MSMQIPSENLEYPDPLTIAPELLSHVLPTTEITKFTLEETAPGSCHWYFKSSAPLESLRAFETALLDAGLRPRIVNKADQVMVIV